MKKLIAVLSLFVLAACSSNPPQHAASAGGASRDVIPYAKSLIGTPYHYGGETPRTGFDCSGFVKHVYSHTRGVQLPRSAHDMSGVGQRLSATQLQPGDLVFFNTLGRPYSHVGIYLGNAQFIHSPSTGKRVEIVDMKMNYWAQRYNGARRVTNLR
ncbi:MAG TPA: C40 family peptidase [Gallionellaceae bacterium]